jgi:hypothetical protein
MRGIWHLFEAMGMFALGYEYLWNSYGRLPITVLIEGL